MPETKCYVMWGFHDEHFCDFHDDYDGMHYCECGAEKRPETK